MSAGRPAADHGRHGQLRSAAAGPVGAYLDTHQHATGPARRRRGLAAPLDGQRGVIYGYGGHVRGIDLFDRATTLAHYWPTILSAVCLEAALTPPMRVRAAAARRFARDIGRLSYRTTRSAGLGEQLRAANEQLLATGLRHQERMVHLAAFTHAAA